MKRSTKTVLPATSLTVSHSVSSVLQPPVSGYFKTIFAGILFLLLAFSATSSYAVATRVGTLAAGTFPTGTVVCKNAPLQVIYSFKFTQASTANTLTSFTFTTTGTYVAADITSFQLYSSTTNAVAAATLVSFGTVTTGLGVGPHTITVTPTQSISAAAHYFFIVANVAAGATTGDNISVATITNTTANFTFTTTTETYAGTAAAAITQTIATGPTVSAASTSICPGTTTALTGTPTGGTWASGTTATATVSATGVVTGVNPVGGTSVITYTQGGCPATVTETVNIGPTPIVLSPASSYTVCPGSSTTVTAAATAPVSTILISNNFNATPNGLVGQTGGTWTINNTGTNPSFGTDVSGANPWTVASNELVLFDIYTVTGDGTPNAVLNPNESDYALVSQLITPSFSTTGYTAGTLSFNNSYYSEFYCPFFAEGDQNFEIDYSLNGGSSWTLLRSYYDNDNYLFSWTATTNLTSVVLTAGMLNQPNVMLRWYYNGTDSYGWWAIDNVVLQCSPTLLPTSAYTWAGPAGVICTSCTSAALTPTAGGVNIYTASATYLTCTATTQATVNVVVPPLIASNAPVCVGSNVTLTDANTTGTWSSSNTALATVNSTTGAVTGVASGNPNITYILPPGCPTSTQVTINPLPNVSIFSVPSATNACPGTSSTITVNSSTLGTASYKITYTLSGANTATATTTLNMVSGVGSFNTVVMTTSGLTTLVINSITNLTNCSISPTSGDTVLFTVNTLPGAISGGPTVCVGGSTSLTDGGGGTWASGNTAIATVDALGNVNGVSGGVANIIYTLPSGCTTTSAITVNSVPSIAGISAVCFGQTAALSDASTGGTWSSTNTAIASIGTATGVVTAGTSVGATTISYISRVNGCAATLAFGVTNTPGVFTVTGGGPYCSGGTGVHIGLTGSNPDVSYQLYVSGTTAVGSAILGTGSVLDFGAQTIAGTYTVVANPGTSCATTMVGNAVISINPLPPDVYTVSGGGSFCAGGIGVHIFLSNSDFGYNYQLFNGTVPMGAPVAGVAGLLTFPLQTASGVYTVVAINAATGCTKPMSGSATITNYPLPNVYIVTGGGPFCNTPGATGVGISLSNSDAGTTYRLYNTGVLAGTLTGTGSFLSLGLQTVSGTYTVIATSPAPASCVNTMSGSATVTSNPLPTLASVTGGGPYCAGGTGVAVGLGSSQIGVSYQLFDTSTAVGSPVTGTTFALGFGLQTGGGLYTVLATNATTGCQNTMTGSVTVSVNPLPVNTYSVTGGGSYCTGGTGVALGLSGSVTGTSYQLYNGATATGIIRAGTGSTLSFGTITTAGTYYVVGTITATGCTATMAGNAAVVINTPPRAYTVLGGGNYCIGGAGEPVVLNGSTNGIQYQLYNGTTAVVGDTLIGTGYALTFSPLTPAGSYNIVATNEATTCTSNMTGSAVIAINPLPTVYTVTGGGGICPGGSGVHVGLGGSDMGVNYQLLIGGTPSGIFAGTGGPLDFGLRTIFANYTVTATNTVTGCTNAMSGFASVGPNTPPSVYPITPGGSNSYCAGSTGVPLGLGNSTLAVNYQLYLGSSPVGPPVPGSGFGIGFGTQTAAGNYTVIATNPVTTCTSNMSGTDTISINALPTIYTVTGGGGYCTGGTGVPVGLSGSATGVSYQLTPTGVNMPGTGTAISFGNETLAGTYTILATNTTTTCSANMFSSAAVVINTPPTAYTLSGGGNYCAGGTGRVVGMTSSNAGVNYQLYNGSSRAGIPVDGTGGAISFGLETAPGTYTVVATNLSTTCTNNMIGTVAIAVTALPVADTVTGGGGYCTGGVGVNVGLSNSSTSVNYQLLNGPVLIGGLTAGTGSSLSFGLQLAAGTYTVLATNDTSSCANNMYGGATVVINPLPNIYYVSGGGNHCPGSVGNHVLLNGSDVGVSYQLRIGGVPIGSPIAGTGMFLDFGPQTATGLYSIVAENIVTGCTQIMSGATTVAVSPLPVVDTVTGGGNYCPGGTGAAITLNGSSAGVNYQLFFDGVATGSVVAGTGSALAMGSETSLGLYSIQATDTTTGCSDMMYGSTTVGNYPLPASFVVSGGGSYCPGGAGVPVITGGSEIGVTYQLFDGGVMEGGPVGGTGSGLNFGNQTATGTYTVMATNASTSCSSNMTGSAIVANYPVPTLYTVTGGGNYCTGGTGVSVSLAGSDVGTNYQLYNVGAIGGAFGGTGSVINFGLQTASGSYTVIATNTTTGCTNNMVGAAVVDLRPLPNVYTVSASSSSYCAGEVGVDVFMSMSDPGINYQLYRDGSMVGVPVLGSGSALSFGAQTAGTYTAVGIDATAGCVSNMSGTVSITIKPVPTVYNVIGGGSYCTDGAGQHIGISGSAAGISYQLWRGGTAVGTPVSGTGAALDFGAQTVAGSYTAAATNTVSGCTSDMSGAAVITINPLPGVYTVTGGGSYCNGGTGVAIGLSGSDAVDISYQLSRSGTSVGVALHATGTALSFGAQTIAGTYVVTATNIVTSCSANMASSASISINPLPTVYTITGGGSYCNGGTGVAVGLGGSTSGISYQLYRGAVMVGSSATGTGAEIGFGTQTIAGAYTVIATNDATSCTNNMAGAATITINPLPVVYNVIGGGNYCPGGSGVHVGLDGSTIGLLYQLSLGGTPIAGGVVTGTGSPIDFGLQTGIGAYTVKATNPGTGCTNNMAGSVATALNTPVTPTLTVSTGMGDTVCAGTSITVSAMTTNAGSAPVYLWSVNGVAESYSSAFTYVPSDGDNVSLTLTSSAECATPAAVSSSLVISVLDHELPSVSVSTSPGTEVCQGTSVNFIASPAYGGTTPSYIWVTNGVTAASGPTYSYTPVQGDVVYVQMSSNYPCRLANVVSGSNIVMTVDSALIPVITIIASPSAHVYPGDPITLNATVVNGGPDPTYQWYINGTGIPGAVSNTYTANSYSNLDSVSLQVTSSGPCSGLVGFNSLIIYTDESVAQLTNGGSDLVLIPNPNNGAFTIKGSLGTATDENVSIEVFDMLGQIIYKNQVMARNGNISEQIRLSGNLANGMYMLNIRSGSQNNVFHFVIEQ